MEINFRINDRANQSECFDVTKTRPFIQISQFSRSKFKWWGLYKYRLHAFLLLSIYREAELAWQSHIGKYKIASTTEEKKEPELVEFFTSQYFHCKIVLRHETRPSLEFS